MPIPELFRVLLALWRSGLLRVRPREILPILRAWRRCGQSFAFLSATASLRWGARPALQDDEGVLTFAQLHALSLGLADRLSSAAGVGPGRRVALAAANGRGFVVGLLACTRLGADVLPVAVDLPARVLEKILERQAIEGLLCEVAPPTVDVPCWPWLSSGRETTLEPPPVGRGGQLIVLTSGPAASPRESTAVLTCASCCPWSSASWRAFS
ncbi:MAG: AMP-binding protein [Armatimonadetes bacterium]|nr:AMP-binding protein [Armatimonadota bacterium]